MAPMTAKGRRSNLTRVVVGSTVLSLALITGGSIAGATTGGLHVRSATAKHEAGERRTERTSKDRSTDSKEQSRDGSADTSKDPQSPDAPQPSDG
jgi:hypothetical protein